jgi:hypothetical protein
MNPNMSCQPRRKVENLETMEHFQCTVVRQVPSGDPPLGVVMVPQIPRPRDTISIQGQKSGEQFYDVLEIVYRTVNTLDRFPADVERPVGIYLIVKPKGR